MLTNYKSTIPQKSLNKNNENTTFIANGVADSPVHVGEKLT